MIQHQRPAESATARTSPFYRLGRACARRPWVVMGVWLAVLVAALAVLPAFLSQLDGIPMSIAGSESDRATTLLQQKFTHAFSEQDLIVFQSATLTIKDPAFQQVVVQSIRSVGAQSGVVGIVSPLDAQVTDQVSADGHAAVALVGLRGSAGDLQRMAPSLTSAAQATATPQVRVYVTGEAEIMADMATQETNDMALAERIGLPIALAVLLLAFGSLVAAGLPLLLALVGVSTSFGALWVAAHFTSFNLLVETIVTMIGLGVGVDYAMFITTRFREELARQDDPRTAVAVTLATAGKAIFFSGITVVLALSALFLIPSRLFTDMAVGAMVTVGVTVLIALTLLPAVLGLLGNRVNRVAVPFLRRTLQRPDPENGFWARWARGVMRRPVLWVILATGMLLVLAAPLTRLNLGIDLSANEAPNRPSSQGMQVLQQAFTPGAIGPIQIVVADPHGSLTDADLAVVARLTAHLQQDPRVAEVVSLTAMLDQTTGNHSAATLAAAEAQPALQANLGYLVNWDRGSDTTVIDAVARSAVDSRATMQLVRDIRTTLIPQARGAADLTVVVGGLTAQIVDLASESTSRLPEVIAVVLVLAFLLLTLVFRSVVLPLKAIVMNLLSVGAAYGLLEVIFQQGAGAGIFHFTPTGDIPTYLPILAFAFLFGLSMDYEVFMIGRMREEWQHTHDNELAVVRGLQHSGRAITSAAAIMVAVFLAFTFTTMLEIQEIGFVLAAAVFVDATVIRVLLVPAAMRLLGRWNWWLPRWLDRRLPHISLGEDVGPAPESALSIAEPQLTDARSA